MHSIHWRGFQGFVVPDQTVHEPGCHGIAQIDFAALHLPDGRHHVFQGPSLHDVTSRPRAQRTFGVDGFVVHGQDENGQVRIPDLQILDEIDSGLDIDAVREVAEMVEALRSPSLGVLVITHYSRILRYMEPDQVHVMVDGRVVESGGPEIAERLETEGYATVR